MAPAGRHSADLSAAASNTHRVDLQHRQTTYVCTEHLARFSGLMTMWAIQTAESVREGILCVS